MELVHQTNPQKNILKQTHMCQKTRLRKKKVSGVDWTNTGRRMKENKTLKESTALLLIEDRTCRNQ